MATVLSLGDIAIVQYNSGTTDSFSFIFARDIEAGTVVNFTDNGWLAAGGFRAGEGTVTYTAPTAITAGTVITLTGLNLDDAGDQIIAYQGTQASPTILYLVDLADGNNTVAGDATNDNTTALPPGLTLGQNAVAVGFDNAIYAGPIDGSPPQLFPLISNSANWIASDALLPSLRYNYPPHLDLDSNNSTSLGDDYRAEVTSNGAPVPIADTDSNIDDFDGGFITFAEINIQNQFPGDVLSVTGTLPFGIFAAPFDPATGILQLFGYASHSAYQTAIEQIRFFTDAPVGVTKSIAVWVFDGFWWSNEGTAILTVSSAAAPPHLDLDANNSNGGGADYVATFTTGGPVIPVADTDVSITDPDSTTIQSATITIAINRQSGDALSAGTLPPSITASSYNPFTGILTLTGSATLAEYQTALHQVVFDTTSFSTADRIIRVTVNDGTFDSNVGTTYMHVAIPPPNVPPALDLDANNSTATGTNYLTTFTDGGPAVAVVDADVLITDSDDTTLASATVTLTNGDPLGSLTFNGTPPVGISFFGSNTHEITLTGAASAADYQTALRQITYNNTDTNPSTETRIVDIVVNDGAGNSNTAQALIQVEVVNNSAPVLDLDADDSSGSVQGNFHNAFTENGAPVPIADVDTSITDADSATVLSATITLANPQTGDLLTVSGTLPATITTAGYDPVTGVLTLTGTAARADYAAALTQIRYSNTSDDPVAGDRLIEVVVSDGANDSNLAVSIITVTATNDAPVIAVDPSASYVENAAPVVLAPTATLSDVDDTELHGALVSITAGSFAGDGDILSVGGITSNTVNGITFTWMPAQHALVFSGASSVANYQALLRQVQFQSSSDNPTDFDHSPQRTLTWAVTDSGSVTTATTTINIGAVNDAPQETVAATAAYTENGPPVTISPAATASDVDNSDLIYGGVRIVAGGFDGDVLTINGLQSGTFAGIDFSYDAGLQRLLFESPGAVADYQALMQAVQFGSTSENPTNFGANPTRTLGWGLSDGVDYSSPATTTQITITALNDAPVNTVPGGQTVAEDAILPIVGVSVADIDSSTLTTTLSVAHGILNVTAGPGVTGSGTASVTITGTAAEINAALAGLAYTGNLNFNGADTLTVATNDGTATDTDTIAITVNPVNDAPVLDLDATIGGADYLTAFTDGGPAVAIVDTDVSVIDTDSPLLASATVTLTNPQALDRLTFTGPAPGSIIVAGSGTSVITLTGAASAADYQTALRQITFDNTGTNPSTEPRIIDVVVNDGTAASNTAHAIVEVIQVNNSTPTLDLDGDNSTLPGTSYRTTFTENGTAVAIADTDTLIGDPDIGSTIASATITLANPQIGDLLTATLPLPGGITASAYDPVTGTLTLSNVASLADYETALEAIRFSSAGDTPVAGTRIIQVVVNDGIHGSQPATSFVKVVAVNDAPINTVPGAQTVAEDTTLPIAGVSVADIDSSTLTTTLSVSSGTLNVTAGAGVTGNGTGSVTITGTAAQINTALAGLTYTGNLNFNGPDTLTVATNDGTAIDTDTIAITVNAVNDAPVNTVPAAQTVAEDTTLPIAGVSVADIDSSTLTTLLSVAHGTLNVTAGAGVITGNGTATVTIAGTAAQINTALAGLAYTGNLDFNGADTLTVATIDGTAIDIDTIAITVNPVNDAPALNLDANSSTIGGVDYLTTFTGSAVDIVDTDVSILDTDSPSLASATITLTNPHAGDSLTVDTPPLPAGIVASVYDPVTGVLTLTGTGSAADYQAALQQIVFNTTDPSTETRIIDVVVSDGTAASNIAHAIVEVIHVNTSAPTVDLDGNNSTLPGTNYHTTFTENGTAVAIADTDTLIGDPDIGSTTLASATITLTNAEAGDTLAVSGVLPGGIIASAYNPATGLLTLSGVTSFANYETALEAIRFSSAGDNPVAGNRIIEVVVNDGVNDSQPAISLVTVVAVNDAPALAVAANATYQENAAAVSLSPALNVTDADDTELNFAAVHITAGSFPGDGDTLTVNGATSGTVTGITFTWNPTLHALVFTGASLVANYQALLQTVQFQSTSNNPTDFDASPQRTLTWSVFDGTAITTATTTVDITAVNEAPVNTVPGAQSVAEDTILPIAGVSVADIDSSALTTTLNVSSGTLTVIAGSGVTGNGTGSVTITGTAAQINTALAGLTYTGNLNFNGPDTLTVATNDGTAIDTDTIAITVNAVNDAPVNTVPGAQSVAEDTALPIAGVSVADIDSNTLTTTLSVSSGTLNVTAGAGVTGNGTASVTITGTAAQINTALAGLAYTGNLNFNGADTLTVATSDGTAADIDTIAITVNAVNDAPTNTVPAAQTVAEDTILPIAGVSVADSDSSALTTTLSVAHGILNVTAGPGVTGNGTASVTIAGTAAQINATLAGLAYTGNLNFNGADTLTVATNDGTATDTDTIAITVNAVNDAPINTVPAAQTVAEDTTLPIAGVSVADIDSSALTTTLSVAHGILNVTAGAGVTGNGTASVTITGTAAQINTALAGLAYTGNLNFNGPDTLTVVTSDGTATDTDTIAITVNAVNDAPINTVPAAQTVAEDTILPIAGVSVADIDSSALTTTLSVAHGILNVTAGPGVTFNGTASVTITGTAAEINAALAGLAYTGNLNFNGADTLTVATNDGTATDTDTIAITVNPVNDAPINTVPAAQTVAEDTILPIAGVSVADIDSSTLTTLLSVAHGTLHVTAGAGVITGNGTATVTIAGTAAQINTALAGLAYTGNLNFNGADTLTVATIDGTAAADIDTIAITVNPVNDAPALNLDADSSTTGGVDYLTTFTGSAVAIVDTDVSVVDNDSPSLASATITLTNPHAGDSLIVATPPLPGGITASVYNPVTGVLTLTGAASAADYQTALRQITFDTTTPSTETRIIDVVVNDGTAASNIAHAIVEVTQVDSSAPTLDLDGNNSTLPGTSYHTTFTENGTAVAIADTDTLIGDPDIGSTIASATITLTSPQIGDLLTATLPLPGGITASAYNPATGILTLSGVASFADYETALEAIRFSSAGDNPVAGSRIIQVVVNDGIHDSQPALSLVTVVAANDAPALVVADATYQENAAPVLLSPALSLTDADDTELNFAAVQITAGSFPGDGDTLTVNGATSGTVTGITFAWNPTSHALILSGASLVADYHALLQTVQFHSTSNNPTDFDASPQRTLTWLVSDGTAVTTATTTLDIVAVNDPPINTVPAAVTAAEDSLLPIAGVSVADIDSSALTTTLSVDHGILNVTDAPGITGNGTAHVTIAGTATQINTALAGLAYAGGPDFLGRDTLTVATSDGAGTDTDTIAITVTVNALTGHAHCDFDGDGGSDILWQDDNGTAAMWLMDGPNATFVGAVGPSNPGPSWEIKATGDFNGDGKADIIWQGDDGTASMWLMDGTNATFIGAVGHNPGPSWQIKGTGDFNGDDKADIIWQHDDGTAAMWLMDGTNATFVGTVGHNPGPSWQIKGTGDFNGDSKSDILWQGSDGTPAIWLMDGTSATFVGAVGSFNPGPSWQIKGTGDFNGDGKSDILWQDQDGTAAVWLMDGTNATFVGAIGHNPGPTWQIKGTGDFNGDGKSDITWQHDSGTPAVWLMDGTDDTVVDAFGPFNPGATWDMIA